ncbi:hypothetical protein L916_04822 [Phytophthora nicotianae]|uniref:Uncharacterized protein n=1 Tax=Phytophthora nicotianae TaxID=4792 RepID=W2JGS7_PHYNI|nr:hypothetical protein L916_04822 [Phytophthora nicotianae]
MAGQHVADHSRDYRRLNRQTITSKQALATVIRLQQWKKHNDAKREVKARLQEDERMEEEEYFLSLSKALPVGQVQAAALRNYQAAGKLRWKKLMFQSIAEQQQLDEEMAECTFRPRLVARPRRSVTAISRPSKARRSSCAAAAANSAVSRSQSKQTNGEVFDRLYKPQTNTSTPTHVQSWSGNKSKRISSQVEAAFMARQERDQVDRQRRLSELAAQLHHFPYKPRLSRHSQEICTALLENDTDQHACHHQREHKTLKPKNRVRYSIPPCTSVCSNKHTPDFTHVPFTTLVEELKQQEQRMRGMTKIYKATKETFER